MSDPEAFDPDFAGLSIRQWCDGHFLLEDMDGEHCRECAAEIFGDDA